MLNFSQPQGTPSTGIISSNVAKPEQVHVDLEDCTLMGYKVFGTCNAAINKVEGRGTGEVRYTTKGKVRAYVQYRQSVPPGFARLNLWPADVFDWIAPPKGDRAVPPAATKKLTKLPEKLSLEHEMECTPILHKGRYLMFRSHRVDSPKPDLNQMYLLITDGVTGEELSRFGRCHSLGSAFVDGETVHVFAAEHSEKLDEWCRNIYHFSSADLKNWKRELAILREGKEHLLNYVGLPRRTGIPHGLRVGPTSGVLLQVRALKDLARCGTRSTGWRLPVRAERNKRLPGDSLLEAVLLRDLHPSGGPRPEPLGGMLGPIEGPRNVATLSEESDHGAERGEGCDNSDVDLIELHGKTYINYAVGNQDDICELRRAVYPGPMREFFESYFPEDSPTTKVSAVQ